MLRGNRGLERGRISYMAGEFRGSGKYQIGDEKFTPRKRRKKRGGGFSVRGGTNPRGNWGFGRPGLIYVGFLIIRVNRKDKGPANIAFPSGQRVGGVGEREGGSRPVCLQLPLHHLPYLSYLQSYSSWVRADEFLFRRNRETDKSTNVLRSPNHYIQRYIISMISDGMHALALGTRSYFDLE